MGFWYFCYIDFGWFWYFYYSIDFGCYWYIGVCFFGSGRFWFCMDSWWGFVGSWFLVYDGGCWSKRKDGFVYIKLRFFIIRGMGFSVLMIIKVSIIVRVLRLVKVSIVKVLEFYGLFEISGNLLLLYVICYRFMFD